MFRQRSRVLERHEFSRKAETIPNFLGNFLITQEQSTPRDFESSYIESRVSTHATNNKCGEKGGGIEISVDSCADCQIQYRKTDVCQISLATRKRTSCREINGLERCKDSVRAKGEEAERSSQHFHRITPSRNTVANCLW